MFLLLVFHLISSSCHNPLKRKQCLIYKLIPFGFEHDANTCVWDGEWIQREEETRLLKTNTQSKYWMNNSVFTINIIERKNNTLIKHNMW